MSQQPTISSATSSNVNIFKISDDAWFTICYFLNYRELLLLHKTCHYFHNLTDSKQQSINKYWKIQCESLLIDIKSHHDYKTNRWFDVFIEVLRLVGDRCRVVPYSHTQKNVARFEAAVAELNNTKTSKYEKISAACSNDCPNILQIYLSNPLNHIEISSGHELYSYQSIRDVLSLQLYDILVNNNDDYDRELLYETVFGRKDNGTGYYEKMVYSSVVDDDGTDKDDDGMLPIHMATDMNTNNNNDDDDSGGSGGQGVDKQKDDYGVDNHNEIKIDKTGLKKLNYMNKTIEIGSSSIDIQTSNWIENGELLMIACESASCNCILYLMSNFGNIIDIDCKLNSFHKGVLEYVIDRYYNNSGTETHQKICHLVIKNCPTLTPKIINRTCSKFQFESKRYNLLHFAIVDNDVELARCLLNKGADLFATDKNGETPLLMACKRKLYDIIKLLLEAAAKRSHRYFDDDDKKEKEEYRISIFEKGLIGNEDNKWNDESIIFWASKNTWYERSEIMVFILQLAIELKLIDLNKMEHKMIGEKANKKGIRPLVIAVYNNNVIAAKHLIFKFNVDVNNAVNPKNSKPVLHCACSNGNFEMVQVLLMGNVNVDTKCEEFGDTALMVAARLGHLDIVNWLITYRADVFITNLKGMTAFSIAAMNKEYQILKCLYYHLINNKKCDKNKIQAYVDQAESKSGQNAYMLACKTGHQKTIDVLIKICHVNVTKRDKTGKYGSDLVDNRCVELKQWLKHQELLSK